MIITRPQSLPDRVMLEDWGLIPYQDAFEKQKKYVEEILNGERLETLIFCSHPSVLTLGRGTRQGDVTSWSGETVEVNRGGRATLHGPHQIIFYPLTFIDEQGVSKKIKSRDLHDFFRILEESVVQVLQKYGVSSQGHSLQRQVGATHVEEATGVWIGDQKIAALGIAIKKWLTSHGLALNFEAPPPAQGFLPCGFQPEQVTSFEQHVKEMPTRAQFQQELLFTFCRLFYTE